MSARPSATPCVSMKPRRQAQAPAANEANSKGKSHEGSGRQGRHRHRRRHPDRRGRGARCAATACASPCWTWTARAARGRRRRPAGCRAWQVDITDDARLEQCVAEAARHFGRLDFLVNLAATYLDDGAASGRADWLRALDINLVSAVAAPRAPGGGRRRRHRQLHQHLGQGRADGRWLYPVSRPRWCSSHATWRWTSPATASASIRCRQAGPGRA